MDEFDEEIALVRSAPGHYQGALSGRWRIGGGVNGGLLLALAANAMSRALADSAPPGDSVESGHSLSRHLEPLSITAHFLSPSTPGPVLARTEVVRRGRTVCTTGVSLRQPQRDADAAPDGTPASNGEERVRALALYGDLAGMSQDVRTAATPPDLPPPERCHPAAEAPPAFLKHAALLERLDLRLDPATTGWVVGRPSGVGVVRGWLRLADGREPDPLMLLLAVDALPPVAFELGLPGWTPTLELTAHVRARPAPGWLRVQTSTRNLAGGYLEEDAEVWDSDDRLVAQSRQLARVTQAR